MDKATQTQQVIVVHFVSAAYTATLSDAIPRFVKTTPFLCVSFCVVFVDRIVVGVCGVLLLDVFAHSPVVKNCNSRVPVLRS